MRLQPSVIRKLAHFDKVVPSQKPLVLALAAYCKMSDLSCTVFLQRNASWILLLENERVIFPTIPNSSESSHNLFKLFATPFFVKDPKTIERYLQNPVFENVYRSQNNHTILYLDEWDIPYPGGHYFDDDNGPRLHLPEDDGGKRYRLCFLSNQVHHENDLVHNFINEWKDRPDVYYDPLKTRTAFPSSFIEFLPSVNPEKPIPFPIEYNKSTALIQKQWTYQHHPQYIVQDILNTYDQRNSLEKVGLLIEYPFQIGFENATRSNPNGKCIGLVVNGSEPETILYVRSPYQRYMEYQAIPTTVHWIPILYEPETTYPLQPVVLCSTIIGFEYKKAFLCLSYVMLESHPKQPANRNTACLFHPVTDVSELTFLESYEYDCQHALHRVRYASIPHDLWCLTKIEEEKPVPLAKPYAHLPYLVQSWLEFYHQNRSTDPEIRYGNLKLFQLALTLARHKICFSAETVETEEEEGIIVPRNSSSPIVIRLSREARKFLDIVRLRIEFMERPVSSPCVLL